VSFAAVRAEQTTNHLVFSEARISAGLRNLLSSSLQLFMLSFFCYNERGIKMKEEQISRKELFAKAMLSESVTEARTVLYQIAGTCGEFPRRLFLISDSDRVQVLTANGMLEYFPESQMQVLKERSEKGQLSAGGCRCLLIPIVSEGSERIAYWITYADLKNRALDLMPDLALIIAHIKSIERASEKDTLLESCFRLNSLIPSLLFSDNVLTILRTLFPVIQDLCSPSLAVLGIRKKGGIDIAIMERGGLSAERILEKDVLPAGKTEESILAGDDHKLKAFSTALKLPAFRRGFFAARSDGNDFYSFILLGNPGKEPVQVFELLRLFLTVLSASVSLKEPSIKLTEKSGQLSEAFKLLAARNERMDKVIHSLPTGVLLLTLNGEIEFSNANITEHIDITRVEISEKRLLRSKEPGKIILGLLEKTEEERKVTIAPIQLEGRWIQLVISKLDATRFLVQSSDITTIKKDMEERKHLFSLVTHEVKNPLAAILSASELLYTKAAELKEGQLDRLIDILYKNSKEMKDILEDVSLYGKSLLGSGRGASVSLKHAILKILEEKADTARATDITIVNDLDEIVIFEQAGMVETLLSNLLGNAIKYSGFEGRVGIRLVKLADKALLEVIDDGVGIPPEDLSNIGEAFFRAGNVRGNYAGTGLGLMIVKNIVSHMRGVFKVLSPISKEDRIFIGCKNNLRKGTKIEVSFPITGGSNAKQDSGR
jgi:signal transduction histidine kinase